MCNIGPLDGRLSETRWEIYFDPFAAREQPIYGAMGIQSCKCTTRHPYALNKLEFMEIGPVVYVYYVSLSVKDCDNFSIIAIVLALLSDVPSIYGRRTPLSV